MIKIKPQLKLKNKLTENKFFSDEASSKLYCTEDGLDTYIDAFKKYMESEIKNQGGNTKHWKKKTWSH